MNTLLRSSISPTPDMNWGRSIGWALLTHLGLVLALSWGVHWNRNQPVAAFEVEVISDVIQQAAARAPEPIPEPPPPPPAPKAQPPAASSAAKPDIVSQKAKEKKRLEAEAEKKKALAEKQKQEKAAAEQARKQKLAKEQAERAKRAEAEDKRQQAVRDQIMKDQQARLAQLTKTLPGAVAREGAGSQAKSSGPSAGYGALVIEKVRPNIIYLDQSPGNPSAMVEVTAAPNGTIIGKKLLKSSGVPAWDQAVLRAIDRTGSLPKDKDGPTPTRLEIVFTRNEN